MPNRKMRIIRPMKGGGTLRTPDAIGLPFGDLMRDDKALETFLDDTSVKMYDLGKMKRKYFKGKVMSKRSFEDFMKKAYEIDDDKPLRAYI